MSAKKATKKSKPPTRAVVRMYRLGTGDCFVIKFFSGTTETFKMMIDCGAWQGKKEKFREHVEDLQAYVDNHLDALVVTHEHKDHVLGFELCEDLFTGENGTGFTVAETWMAWAEQDGAPAVEKLKKEHGAKKKALAAAAALISDIVERESSNSRKLSGYGAPVRMEALNQLAGGVNDLQDLQMAMDGKTYAGPLAGMASVKNKISKKGGIRFFKPGDVIEDVPGLDGVRIYVLGPPSSYDAIKAEGSKKAGEAYDHNKDLARSEAFAAAAALLGGDTSSVLPFADSFEGTLDADHPYQQEENDWRRIDHDWLTGAGTLALRLNSGINNLSLALAIEFVESGRVMLFPGDAEYGSWASWHDIKWTQDTRKKDEDGKKKHLTEDLLNRTVFYKVAHHLSNNGTAKRLGLEMMTHKDLAAMATLDYSVISKGWTTTMPNSGILNDLLRQTKGRLMVMNEADLFFNAKRTIPLTSKIKEFRKNMSTAEQKAFNGAYKEDTLWIDFTVKA